MSNVVARTSLPSQLLHDLRSPLNQIIGYSEMLSEDIEELEHESVATDLGRIRAAGHRMLAIIEDNFTAGETTLVLEEDERDEIAAETPQNNVEPGLLLVVDDDAMNRDVLSRRLTRQGHIVSTASSGAEALRLMRDQNFDVVLLDIMMPDMDGYEVLGHIKEDQRLRHIPVIMISAVSQLQSVVRCIEAGAEDYLAKPFNPTLLKARIGASLEKKRGRDRETVMFEQLQSNYARLQELEKLRDDLRNMIVHDLRTPLTSVLIGVEMVETLGALNHDQREMMTIAAGGGKTLLGMINDLLDVEKMESGAMQLQRASLSASDLVERAVEQVTSLAAEAGSTIVTKIASPMPPFDGDEKMLSRTLVNLIANAVKFAGRGTVTITADPAGELVRFAVLDSGDGIPAEAFHRIFEKFGQLDQRKIGTGLGLAFCKLAVEAHGGHIQVESEIGVGSTFSFTIPRVAHNG